LNKKPEVLAFQNRSDSVWNTHTITEKLLENGNGSDDIPVGTDRPRGSDEVDPESVVDVDTTTEWWS
jgi:hypothetical protein